MNAIPDAFYGKVGKVFIIAGASMFGWAIGPWLFSLIPMVPVNGLYFFGTLSLMFWLGYWRGTKA